MGKQFDLYQRYFAEKGFERLNLFELIRDVYGAKSAIYLGSFLHLTPAYVFPNTAFVDSDKRFQRFFNDVEVRDLINQLKQYDQDPEIYVSQQDYDEPIALEDGSFDLLISQYAGFVSQAGKRYLKQNGILLANNSHGDAAMAFVDSDYELIGVANNTKDKWRITTANLEEYFVPKKGSHPTKPEIEKAMKGIGYKTVARNYLFRKI